MVFVIMMEEVIDGFHIVVNLKTIFFDIGMKLVDGFIERKSINDSFILQVLPKMDRPITSHQVSIILDQINQAL